MFDLQKVNKINRIKYLKELKNNSIEYMENTPIYEILYNEDGFSKVSGFIYKSIDNTYIFNNYNIFNKNNEFLDSSYKKHRLSWKYVKNIKEFVKDMENRGYVHINKKVKDISDLTNYMIKYYNGDTKFFKIVYDKNVDEDLYTSLLSQLKLNNFNKVENIQDGFTIYNRGIKYNVYIEYLASDWETPVDPTSQQCNRRIKVSL